MSHVEVSPPCIFLEPLNEISDKRADYYPSTLSPPFLLKGLYRYVLPLVVLHLPQLNSRMVSGEEEDDRGAGGSNRRTAKRDDGEEEDEKRKREELLSSIFHQALFAGLHLLQLPPYAEGPLGVYGQSPDTSYRDNQRPAEEETGGGAGREGGGGKGGGRRGAEDQGDSDAGDEEEESRIFACFLHLALLHLICIARGRSVFVAIEKQKKRHVSKHVSLKEPLPASTAGVETGGADGVSTDGAQLGARVVASGQGRGTESRTEVNEDSRAQSVSRTESWKKREEEGRARWGGAGETGEEGGQATGGGPSAPGDAGEDSSSSRKSADQVRGERDEEEEEEEDSRDRGVGKRSVAEETDGGVRGTTLEGDSRGEEGKEDRREEKEWIPRHTREKKNASRTESAASGLFSRIVVSALDEELRICIESIGGVGGSGDGLESRNLDVEVGLQDRAVPDSAEIHLVLLLLLRWMSRIVLETKDEEEGGEQEEDQDRGQSVHGADMASPEEGVGEGKRRRDSRREGGGGGFSQLHTGRSLLRVCRRRSNLRVLLQGQVYRYPEAERLLCLSILSVYMDLSFCLSSWLYKGRRVVT